MKREVNELEKVIVKNKTQLDEALKPFMTDSAIYKLLVEGMDLAKRQALLRDANQGATEDYGGFLPAKLQNGDHYLWVDTLIDRRLNAKRSGTSVYWDLPEGHFEFDPWTRKLEQKNATA